MDGLAPLPAANARRCVVTIPVRNEARRIAACLDALNAQVAYGSAHVPAFQVLLVLNGCTDRTHENVLAWQRRHGLPVRVMEVELAGPRNHAGGARAAALAAGMALLGSASDGVVMTTDADSRVLPGWIERAVCLLDSGCDAVAGEIDVAPGEFDVLPEALRERHRQELTYGALLDEVDAACDPLPHNPWPRHSRCSGANLAFRVGTLAMLGELPSPPYGEDRALIDACLARDLRVRHDPLLRVETSARLRGRARGGMADTLRHRQARIESPCDLMLETLQALVFRATLRATGRRVFRPGLSATALAQAIGIDMPGTSAEACGHFGIAWQRLEASCPVLGRHPIRPSQLPDEIRAARAWLESRPLVTWKEEVAA